VSLYTSSNSYHVSSPHIYICTHILYDPRSFLFHCDLYLASQVSSHLTLVILYTAPSISILQLSTRLPIYLLGGSYPIHTSSGTKNKSASLLSRNRISDIVVNKLFASTIHHGLSIHISFHLRTPKHHSQCQDSASHINLLGQSSVNPQSPILTYRKIMYGPGRRRILSLSCLQLPAPSTQRVDQASNYSLGKRGLPAVDLLPPVQVLNRDHTILRNHLDQF